MHEDQPKFFVRFVVSLTVKIQDGHGVTLAARTLRVSDVNDAAGEADDGERQRPECAQRKPLRNDQQQA